jgi:hypothetical protein
MSTRGWGGVECGGAGTNGAAAPTEDEKRFLQLLRHYNELTKPFLQFAEIDCGACNSFVLEAVSLSLYYFLQFSVFRILLRYILRVLLCLSVINTYLYIKVPRTNYRGKFALNEAL